ncbi:hypothetical protein ACLOJK_024829 [Asimina triloba]
MSVEGGRSGLESELENARVELYRVGEESRQVRAQPWSAPLADKATVLRLQIELSEVVVVVVEVERGRTQASTEAQQALVEALAAKEAKVEGEWARLETITEKWVAELKGELRCVLKVKREEGPFGSGAPMPVQANVQDVVLGEYLSSATFRLREASNRTYIRDGYLFTMRRDIVSGVSSHVGAILPFGFKAKASYVTDTITCHDLGFILIFEKGAVSNIPDDWVLPTLFDPRRPNNFHNLELFDGGPVESEYEITLLAPECLASWRPNNRASYSTTLLVIGKPNLITYSMAWSSGVQITMLAPPPKQHEEPSLFLAAVNRNLVGTSYLSADQKKKLLWGNKKNITAEEGVKGDVKLENKPNDKDRAEQEQLQLDLEKQYTAGLRRRDGRTVGLGLVLGSHNSLQVVTHQLHDIEVFLGGFTFHSIARLPAIAIHCPYRLVNELGLARGSLLAILTRPDAISWMSLAVGIDSSSSRTGKHLEFSWMARVTRDLWQPKSVPVIRVPPWTCLSLRRLVTGSLQLGVMIGNDRKAARNIRNTFEDFDVLFFCNGCRRGVGARVGDGDVAGTIVVVGCGCDCILSAVAGSCWGSLLEEW